MPMTSQASGAVAHSFAIERAVRRQVSTPDPPCLAGPQRTVNSYIHATNGPRTPPPWHTHSLRAQPVPAPGARQAGCDEATAACPAPRARARDLGPRARRRSTFAPRASPSAHFVVRRPASPSTEKGHARLWPSTTPPPRPTSASTPRSPQPLLPTFRTHPPSTPTDPMVGLLAWLSASSPPSTSAVVARPPDRRPTPPRRGSDPNWAQPWRPAQADLRPGRVPVRWSLSVGAEDLHGRAREP